MQASVVRIFLDFEQDAHCSHGLFTKDAATNPRDPSESLFDTCLVIAWTGYNALITEPSNPSDETL